MGFLQGFGHVPGPFLFPDLLPLKHLGEFREPFGDPLRGSDHPLGLAHVLGLPDLHQHPVNHHFIGSGFHGLVHQGVGFLLGGFLHQDIRVRPVKLAGIEDGFYLGWKEGDVIITIKLYRPVYIKFPSAIITAPDNYSIITICDCIIF